MESIQKQLTLLIEEGEKFTFSNFCLPQQSGREYGGSDSPQWLTWKTRSANLIRQVVSDAWKAVTYSNERYEPCCFPNGEWFGTPEQAFELGAVYL